MAAGLLRRAAVHASQPISLAHFDCILRAQLALAEVVEGSGATLEECHALYASIAARDCLHLGGSSEAVKRGIAASQHAARCVVECGEAVGG